MVVFTFLCMIQCAYIHTDIWIKVIAKFGSISIGQIWREIRVSLVKCKSWTRTSIKITSYLGTDSESSLEKPDKVKIVLCIAEECGMPCFHWLFTKRQMSIRTAEVRPYCFLFFFFALVEA